ncbi:MFS transporter [Shewanella sp. GXUN23E]|uniref:MFS transporter n=1 Tax=Shewanella sp. GXUN23E TaxID=3422498 RepID=UPI003D7DFD89
MNTSTQSFLLLVLLIMFPQIAETIYSPALTDIASAFAVSQSQAGQTLSIYFVTFAIGVVCWGVVADVKGRRPALLAGLSLYVLAAVSALFCQDFELLLLLRAVSAFGAASCSIVVQTMLRDRFEGDALSRAFAVIGIGISISPALGMLLGGLTVDRAGYMGMFAVLGLLALLLLGMSWRKLGETRKSEHCQAADCDVRGVMSLAMCMLSDRHIWRSALLVAGFNLLLFAYFQLAPFLFQKLGMNAGSYGSTGLVLALATLAGSVLNQKLLKAGYQAKQLVYLGVCCAAFGAPGVLLSQHSLWFLVMQALICIGFALTVPNVLCEALIQYRQWAGTAGALLGLFYYSLLGLGLQLSGQCGDLGVVLTVTTALMLGVLLMGKASRLCSRLCSRKTIG